MRTASPVDGFSNVGVVIPAAGGGSRFGGEKQFKDLGGRAVILHSLSVFLEVGSVTQVAVAVSRNNIEPFSTAIKTFRGFEKVIVVEGGKRRQDSVLAALNVLNPETETVCIHDAARPFVTPEMIQAGIFACKEYDGAVTALPITDTVKIVEPGGVLIRGTRDRSDLWGAQTPQTFKRAKLEKALAYSIEKNISATDEAFLMEELGYSVCVVPGSPENIKITRPEDWKLAEAILGSRNG